MTNAAQIVAEQRMAQMEAAWSRQSLEKACRARVWWSISRHEFHAFCYQENAAVCYARARRLMGLED